MTCPYEDDLLDALGRGYVDPDLSEHAAGCVSCGELRLVAGGLLEERAAAVAEAPVPSAGTMWWRMQLRRRHEAEAAARRSLLIGQAATLLVAISLAAAFFGSEVAAALRVSIPLLVAFATLLLAPLVGWISLRNVDGALRRHRR